ncbi:579_t:CDS:1, partial [Acaulospora colombiana]
MTRTARASSPQALMKDRSVARNGRDKSLKKGGFHGWGDLKHEAELEQAAQEDEARDREEERREDSNTVKNDDETSVATSEEAPGKRARRASTLGEVP